MPSPLALGEWQPDLPAHMSPALVQADNVLSLGGAYAPFPGHVPVSGVALPATATGFFPTLLDSGAPIVYAASNRKIYLIRNGILTQVYDATPIDAQRFWFAQVGGKMCAGCEGLPPVGGDLGGAMAPLGGNPPGASVGAVVHRDYLVLGNLQNEPVDGNVPNRVRWSGVLNPDTWGTNIATGADFEDMHDEGGPVVAISGRTVGLVFQRKAITRMQFTENPSTVFAFTVIELGRGAVSAGAVCDAGPIVCYRSDDGFFAHDGTQSIPIGAGKVDDWFANNADPGRIDLMRSGYDPVHRCAMWAYTENGHTTNNAILAYSLVDSRWTRINVAMQDIASSATFPATIESMPTPDTDPIPWDDGSRLGKQPVLAGINSASTYGLFNGAALASTLVTGDFQSSPGQRAFVSGVRPISDAATAKVALGTKSQKVSDPIVWNAATAPGVDGVCPQRADARFHRFRLTTDAGDTWTRSSGLEPEMQGSGER